MPSFSEVFLAYLSAAKDSKEETQRLLELLLFERKPRQWIGGMRQELETFSENELTAVLATKGTEIPSDVRDRIERKWILLANVLRNPWRFVLPANSADRRLDQLLVPRIEEARLLLHGLYLFIRGVEKNAGRWWHKGTICWFLADSHVETNDLESALTYYSLAAIEDAWSFVRSPRTAQRPEALPAVAGLRLVAPYQADQLLASWIAAIKRRKTWSAREPELTYLATMCRLELFAMPRGPLPFSTPAAEAFLLAADNAHGNNAKGEAYELLLAFLFESTEGFQAVLNAIGRDQENDLLVINKREDIPLRCLGEFLICQCKNTASAASAAIVREFAGRLLEAGCQSGVFLCKKGISGHAGDPTIPHDAVSTRIKARQREGMSILALDRDDVVSICSGKQRFTSYLSDEYVRVRFDLPQKARASNVPTVGAKTAPKPARKAPRGRQRRARAR